MVYKFLFTILLISFASVVQGSPNIVENNGFMLGHIKQIPLESKVVVNKISSEVLSKTGFNIFVNILDSLPSEFKDNNKTDFVNRRDYESTIINQLPKPYAIIFFYYTDHKISLESSEGFLDSNELLEKYAFPYLPNEKIGSDKYDDGINKGLSNIYLALVKEVGNFYKVEISAPFPLEKPSGMIKGLIYLMIFSLLGLFVLVRFKILGKKK